jgi:two-component system cell cycle sensor histidine kinase/response regulator CckA
MIHKAVTPPFTGDTRVIPRALLDGLEAIVWEMDPVSWQFTFVSAAAEWILGHPIGQWTNEPNFWQNHIHPDDRDSAVSHCMACVADGCGHEFEYRMVASDGRAVWLRDIVHVVPASASTPAQLHGVMFDISSQKHRETTVAESEERYRELVQRMGDAVVVHVNGEVVFVNSAAVDLVGAERLDQVVGKSVLVFIHPDDAQRGLAQLRTLVEEQTPQPLSEFRIVRLDGTVRNVEFSATTVRFGGAAGAVQIVCRDVTERIRTAEALRDTALQLQQSQKLEAVGRLAGGVAHDFNNLLTVITGFTQIVLEQLADDDPRYGDLREVQRAADGAAKLTRQLLAFSRKQLLQPAELDLNVIVADAEKMLARVIGEDLHLVVRHAPDGARLRADRGQLEQVLMNLVVNARDAMPHGGVLTVITDVVTLSEAPVLKRLDVAPGRYVRLQVVDTGVGMPPEVAAFVFEPFFTTKPPTTGTGLGLSMVYGIVKQSGGAIALDTSPGRGATFSLYFPEVGSGTQEDPNAVAAAPGQGETILLVEDSDAVRMVARRILTGAGYCVLSADGGKAALDIAQAQGDTIDLLLTDVVMPGMNGRKLAERLQARTPGLRVLFMSGYTEDEVVRRGVASGVPLLQKPFTMEGIIAAVRTALDQPAA